MALILALEAGFLSGALRCYVSVLKTLVTFRPGVSDRFDSARRPVHSDPVHLKQFFRLTNW